jgi:hypothetical protein
MSSEQLDTRTDIPLTHLAPQQAAPFEVRPESATVLEAALKEREEVVAPAVIKFPQKLLNVGFCTALVLAGGSFIMGALYLNNFLSSTNQGVQSLIGNAGTLPSATLYSAMNATLVMGRLALLSCGVFIGMSFGFLGFALFLMGIKEEMNVVGRYEGYHIKLARLSPGVFVILCATILIGICVTHETPFTYYYQNSQTPSDSNLKPKASPDLPGPVDTRQPHN